MTPWREVNATAKRLGFFNYTHYLESDHWKALKRRKGMSPCATCESEGYRVHHHIRYRNLLDVEPADLVVLCKSCHDDFHMACRVNDWNYIGMDTWSIAESLITFRASTFYARWKARKERKQARRALKKENKSVKAGIRNHFRRFLKGEATRATIAELCKKLMGYSQCLPPSEPPL